VKNPTWSFSAIKLFEQCPRKYYHLKIKKDVTDEQNEAALYGEQFHEAAEFYVSDQAELPTQLWSAKKALDKPKALPGEKLC